MSVIALTSCANNTSGTTEMTAQQTPLKKEYTALVIEGGGLGDDGEYISTLGKSDIDLSLRYITKTPAPEDVPLTFNGNTYNGKYSESSVSPYYGYERECFVYKSDTFKITYMINEHTKQLQYYSILYNSGSKPNYGEKDPYSQEECITMAKEYLKQYVHDIEKYTVLWMNKLDFSWGAQYDMYFKEYIGDVAIPNIARIRINEYGEIMHFHYRTAIEDVEAFKESGYLETIDWDSVYETAEKKACEAFEACEYYNNYDFYQAINNEKYKTKVELEKMADGRYALQLEVYVFMSTKESPDIGRIGKTEIFIYLD